MNLDAIRTELAAQHTALRSLIDGLRAAMTRDGNIADHLVGLASALRDHNRREEELLRGVLVTLDAWGGVREEITGAFDVRHLPPRCTGERRLRRPLRGTSNA